MTVEGSVQLPRAPSPTVIVLLLCSLVAAASKSATFDNHQSTRTGTPPPPLPTSYSERFARWAWPAAAIMTADLEVINDCFINNKTFTKWQPLTTDCDGPVCRAAIGRTTTGTQGMVFVVVQGTVDFWELYNQLVDSQLVDLTIGGTTYGQYPLKRSQSVCLQVHQYYLDVAKLFYAQLSQLMDDYGEPGDLLIFLGHSMAGIVSDVLSTLFALDYGYPADLIRLYTFGAPEGADLIYSINHFSHTFGQSYQVLHIGDPIPKAYQVWAPAFVSSPWLILYRTRQMLPNQTRTCDFQDMAQCVDYPTDWDTDSHLCYFTVRQGVHACEGQLNCDLPRLESGSAIPETSDSFKSLFAMLSVVEKRPDVNLLPELKARVHVSGDILKAIANAWHVESAVEVDFEAHDCPSANSDAMCVSIRVVSTGNLMAFNKDFYNATGSNRFECPINVFVEALRNLLISDELRR